MEPEKKEVYLVATDFTKIGEYAIDNAAQMARLTGAKLVVLHVVNEKTKSMLKRENKKIDSIGTRLNEICKKVEAQHGVEADFLAPEGSIFSTIAETARNTEATYLFLGTHGKKGVQFLLGSFALKVITTSPAPMFVVKKPSQGNKFKNFVYPLDTELGSKQKVKWAIELNRFLGAAFHILVYYPNDEPIQHKMNGDLKQVTNIMDQYKVPYTIDYHKTIKGFEQAVVDLALAKKADAIMMSTDPDKITWNPFGSPEEKLIYNKEAIPVLCINSQDLKVIIGGP
ncbi:MAG: universal stress protein [Bacteroidales bacterium]|jgi:nucleotide-binding universal stress UspA family protein|nr:universal stress protein [Bacteroidales bacterium]NLM93172.1 universal stress protein [Bacteroidales bacterium]